MTELEWNLDWTKNFDKSPYLYQFSFLTRTLTAEIGSRFSVSVRGALL